MPVKKDAMGADMPLVGVVEDRAKVLARLRDRLSAEIDITGDQRSLCLLAAQLRQVLSELEQITPPELSAADEIQRRREARRRKGQPVSFDHSTGGGGRGHS